MRRFTKVSGMLLLLLMTAWTQMFAQNYFMKVRARKSSELENGMQVAFKAIADDNSMWINWGAAGSTSSITKYTLETADENNKWYIKNTEGRYLKKSSSNNSIEWVETSSDATALRAFTPTLQSGNTDSPNEVNNSGKLTFPEWTNDKEGYQIRFTDDNNNFLNVQSGSNSSAFGTGNGSWSVVMVYDLAPYLLSAAPSNGQFSEKTYWHYLKINSAPNLNRYAAYTEEVDGNDNQISLTPSNPVSYGSFWAFVKTNDGIQIYNAATGTSKVLTVSDVAYIGGDATVYMLKMIDNTTSTKNVWSSAASGRTGYYQFKTTENYYINHTDANLTTDGKGKTLYGKPNATGEWSDLMFEPVENIETLIEETRNNQQAISGAVGALASESYNDFTAALNKGTAEGLAEALKIRDLTGTTVQFDPSKYYYRIENVTRKRSTGNTESVGNGGYLEYADENEVPEFKQTFYAYDKGADRAGAIWKFEAVEGTEGAYKLQSLNSKQYIKSNGSRNSTMAVATQEEATGFKLSALSATAQFNIVTTDNTTYRLHVTGINDSDKGNVIIYTDGGANGSSAWYIIPATTIDVTIGSAKYATVNYPFAVQLPKDGTIAAYTANTISGNNSELLLKKIADGFIPAYTPVVLEGDAKTYTLNIVAGDKTEPLANNILEGTTLFETKDRETKVYVLGYNETKGVGFYKLSEAEGANRTITANKAYLPATNLPGTAQMTKGFTFSFDDNSGETTGIEDATINLAEEEFYDLQGRRVLNPTKGIYVTKSGKKILFSK